MVAVQALIGDPLPRSQVDFLHGTEEAACVGGALHLLHLQVAVLGVAAEEAGVSRTRPFAGHTSVKNDRGSARIGQHPASRNTGQATAYDHHIRARG